MVNGKKISAPLVSPKPNQPSNRIRLNRFLASCGVASRRACDAIIFEGRVQVNGALADSPGIQIDPTSDVVAVDSVAVSQEALRYLAINKPAGIICSADDPQGRPTIFSLLSDVRERTVSVGRLDFDSEGLLLLTNDGSLAQHLSHPRHHVSKVYKVWTERPLNSLEVERLEYGIEDEGDVLEADRVEWNPSRDAHLLTMTLSQGKNRQIRRMVRAVGQRVQRLQRIQVGGLKLGSLPLGEYRDLSVDEVTLLKKESGLV